MSRIKLLRIVLTVLGVAYAASPFDFLPDFMVGLGWIDDIVLLIFLWKLYQFYKKKHYSYQPPFGQTHQYQGRGAGEGRSGEGSQGAGIGHGGEGWRKNAYMVLDLDRNASQDEIKKAFRQLSNKYHPDKVSHLGDEFKELAEKRFKEIQEAYGKLRVK